MSVRGEAWFLDSFWWGNSERGWGWRFLFDGIWAGVFGVVETSVFVVFGPHNVTVGASIERTVFSEVSKVVTLGAEGFSVVFGWGVFES